MSKVKTTVVTGGAGFVGSHLCARLLALGHRVISLDNYFTGSIETHLAGFDPDALRDKYREERILERLTEPGCIRAGVWQLIHGALERQRPFAGKNLLHDPHVLLQARDRFAVGHSMPSIDDLGSRGAQTDNESSA